MGRKRCGRRGAAGLSSRLRCSPLPVTHPRWPRGRGTCWVGADLQACTHRFRVEHLEVPFGDSWPPLLRDPGGKRVEEGWEVGFVGGCGPSLSLSRAPRGSSGWSPVLPDLPALPLLPAQVTVRLPVLSEKVVYPVTVIPLRVLQHKAERELKLLRQNKPPSMVKHWQRVTKRSHPKVLTRRDLVLIKDFRGRKLTSRLSWLATRNEGAPDPGTTGTRWSARGRRPDSRPRGAPPTVRHSRPSKVQVRAAHATRRKIRAAGVTI